MSNAECGMYIRLLCRAWEQPIPGILPGDEPTLRRLIGAEKDEWEHALPALRRCFKRDDGHWIQKRMREEHEAQDAWMKKQREAGKLGNEVRWGKRLASQGDRNPIAGLSPTLNPKPINPEKKEPRTHLSPDGDVLASFEQIWKAYPHVQGRSSKKASLKLWNALKPRPKLDEILAAIEAFKRTESWQEGFVPGMQRWIREQRWETPVSERPSIRRQQYIE